MSNDVLITPASRKIELKDSSGNVDAKIETDSSGNLLITNAGGDISIGDTTSDVFIGDGTNSVDIVFEQNGEIRGTSGVTLTLGDANTTLRTGTDLSLNSNDITNVGNISTTDMSLSGTMTLTGLINFTPDTADILRFDGQSILKRLTTNGGLRLGHDDCVLIAAGDTTAVMEANIGGAPEKVVVGSEGGLEVYAFPNNDTSWANRDYFIFNGSGITVNGTTIVNTSGQWTGSSSGLKGEPGAKGQKGEVGQKGQKGEVGQKGAPGAKGQKGEVGQKGATGAKGNTGQKGAPGAKGATGAKGNTGQKGAPGAKGQKGEVGQKGQKGQKGQSHATGTVSGVSNSGWTTAFTVDGGGLASQIRATFAGTTGSVVVSCIADIVVGHFQDILVKTQHGFYTLLSIRIISNNNEDFAVQLKTNHANAVALAVEVFPLNNETITFTSSHSYTGATYTHDGTYGVKIGGGGGNSGDLRVGGDYYAGTTKVINANGTWAGSSSGLKGEPGVKGSTGQKGAPGAKGATGTAVKGQKGAPGAKGATGTAVKGQKGEVGQKGAPGAKGQKGEQGASVKGQKGAAGAKGNTGTATKGQKGAPGAKGQKGEVGLTDAPYGAVPAYSNANVNTINWNATEEAMMLESSGDTQIGAAFPAFRVNLASNETHKLSVKLKGNTTGSSGIYIRVYEYNALLPSGKVAVSNSATYGLVQEDTSGKTNWRENEGVTTSWVTHEYTYTPTSGAQWASIVILNWNGFGTNTLYIRDPMWQLIGSSGAKGQKGEVGQKGQKGAAGAKGQKGEVGQKGAPGAKGQKGEVGQKGAPGAKGNTGQKGAPGAKGQKGEVGQKGATGTFSNTSNISITKSLPKIVLDSSNSGDAWTAQGAQISLGESGDGGSAALHLTYRGDGYSYVGTGALTNGIPAYGYLRFQYNATTIVANAHWNLANGYDLKTNGTTRISSGGLIRAANGSVSAPSISLSGDTNTGFFSYSGDTLGFTAGGTRRARFGSTIFLESNDVRINQFLYHNGDTDTYLRYDVDRIRVVAGGVTYIDIVEGATDYMRFNTRGVTIGSNTAPQATLTIDQACTETPADGCGTGRDAHLKLENTNTTGSASTCIIFQAKDSGGNMRHGAGIQFKKAIAWSANGQYPGELYFWTRPTSGNQAAAQKLDKDGNAIFKGNVTAYGSLSDRRLKENIENIPDATEKVQQLNGVTFNYKKDGKKATGLIAQELEEVLPEAVYTTENIETGEEHLAIHYGNVIGLLVESIKELKAEIEDLKNGNN